MLRRLWSDWLLPLLAAVVLALVIRSYVAEARLIPSSSMEPTLQIGDRVIVEKLFFHPGELCRGDVIVFWPPPVVGSKAPFVKRVIGLPGDTVQVKNSAVYINGQPVTESYIKESSNADYAPHIVPQDTLFVMGDNRNYSFDSRFWGFVDFTKVIGKAGLIYWPPGHIGKIVTGGSQAAT